MYEIKLILLAILIIEILQLGWIQKSLRYIWLKGALKRKIKKLFRRR